MSDIDELQRRISAAMDRVASGLEGLAAPAAGESDALRAQLDEEKTANAQLEERLRTLKDKQTQELTALQAQMQEMRARVDTLDLELQRVRQSNQQLRDSNASLRAANEAGVGEPHLINKAMLTELEGLRAARAADVAEASAILSALGPLLDKSGSDGGETQDA